MIKIPEIKKKISSFLTKEDGKISKDNLVKTGVLIAAFSIGAAMSARPVSAAVTCNPDCPDIPNPANAGKVSVTYYKHQNELALPSASPTAVGTHNHCEQSCHVSHSSHGSHGSGGW